MAWLWLVLGVLLAAAETITGSFVLLMFSAGALAAAGVAALGAAIWLQALAFAAVSAGALWLARPALQRHLHHGGADARMGVEQIEGTSGLVLEEIDVDQGLIKIEGEIWSARPYDAHAGLRGRRAGSGH